MTSHNEPHSVSDPACSLREPLREIGRGILTSIDCTTALYRSSPTEAVMLALARFTLQPLVEAGCLEIHSRRSIILPSSPVVEAEVDLLLRVPETGAAGIVEIEGHEWHRSSAAEHDEEVRRDRLVRRACSNVDRFSARGVLTDPWAVLLEIFEGIETGWSGFRLPIPSGMRALAVACVSTPEQGSRSAPSAEEGEGDRTPLLMVDHLRKLVESLPAPTPTGDPAMQALRRDYPRAYVPWSAEEEQALRGAFRAWMDVGDIARALGRTPGAVWCQIRRAGLIEG